MLKGFHNTQDIIFQHGQHTFSLLPISKYFFKLDFQSRICDSKKVKIKALKNMQKWNYARVHTILRPRFNKL